MTKDIMQLEKSQEKIAYYKLKERLSPTEAKDYAKLLGFTESFFYRFLSKTKTPKTNIYKISKIDRAIDELENNDKASSKCTHFINGERSGGATSILKYRKKERRKTSIFDKGSVLEQVTKMLPENTQKAKNRS